MTPIDREQYWDTEEVWKLRTVTEAAAITDLRYGRMKGVLSWAVVDAALQTGLRASELAKLNVGNFNAKRPSLKVWRHKRRKHFQETMAISKALANHLAKFIAWKSDVGQRVAKNAPLFVGKRGRLTASGIAQLWKSTVKRAGVDAERRSIHSARHTMAVHLLKKTGNLRMVQKQLGHASPVTTANMYADVSFDDMKSGVENLYDENASD